MDWTGLRDQAGESPLTPAEVKRELPPTYVLDVYGHTVEDIGGRLATLCPFHADSRPSFDVFEHEGSQRVGCYPCGLNGDVLDLIQWLEFGREHHNFAGVMTKAAALLRSFRQAEAPAPAPTARPRISPERVADAVYEASLGDRTPLIELVDHKHWPVEADFLADVFDVGVVGDDIIIPYRGSDGAWSGYKIRTLKEKSAAPGSKFDDLYAHWLDQGRPDVILCEGEPDTWAATQAVGDRYDVLGTGAGNKVRTERFAGRRVVLALDGDAAGRASTRRWAAALLGVASSVRIVAMPDGYDLCMVPDLGRAIDEARAPLPYIGAVSVFQGVFARTKGNSDNVELLCNWSFTPERELRIEEGGVAYEGYTSSGLRVVLTSDDLSSSTKIHQWSQHYGLGWRGTDKDARDILIWLESEGPFLSPGRMTRVLGLHDGHMVLPDTTFGKDRWVFLPKPGIITKHLDFQARPGWQQVLSNLLDLHQPEVMSPLLAWLAAAPIRSLIDEFPILAVTGSSGAGKTTLLKTVLAAFSGGALGGKDGISLADTTKHAITEHAGASNAIPVWFDEYRASIKQDTRDALHNTLLASYIGQTTSKGAVTDRGLGVTNWEHGAPIVISGESAFAETAHVERMVLLNLPQAGRNAEALAKVRTALPAGIAESYLHWLIYRAELPAHFDVLPAGAPHLPSRVRTNLGVLELGWKMLGEFLWDCQLGDVPPPDWSLVVAEAEEAADDDPILEAARWAVETEGTTLGETLAIVSEGYAWLRVEGLVAEVNRSRRFALPGNAKAVRRVLLEKYSGEDVRQAFPHRGFHTPTRFVRVPLSLLGLVK